MKPSPIVSGVITGLLAMVLIWAATVLVMILTDAPYFPDIAIVVMSVAGISLGIYEYRRCRRRLPK